MTDIGASRHKCSRPGGERKAAPQLHLGRRRCRRALGAERLGSRRPTMHTTIPTFVGFAKAPWNKGRLIGQKRPLKPKEVWSIRVRLQLEGRKRDLALFNLAIDSKLRGCDLVSLQVEDVCVGGRVRDRGTVIQKKTGRPVQFEITEQTRSSSETGCPRPISGTGAIFFRAGFERSRTFRPVNTRGSCMPGSRALDSTSRLTARTRCVERRWHRSIEKPAICERSSCCWGIRSWRAPSATLGSRSMTL